MHSLKKISYLAFVGMAVLLFFVIFLSIRQMQMTERYNTIIRQSEEVLFQFATIREEITTALIENDWTKSSTAAKQLKNLNSALARLQENPLIPGEYRLDMAKQIDLTSLAISSKEVLAANDKMQHSLLLQKKMRNLADYLMKFDRIVVSQMRAKVVRFQTIMIGAMGAVICMISFSLILLYKKTVLPLLSLARQSKDENIFENGFSYSPKACVEVADFTDSVNILLHKCSEIPADDIDRAQYFKELAGIINESTNLSNGIINYSQLLLDAYQEIEAGQEEMKILHNIIEAAERIAEINREMQQTT